MWTAQCEQLKMDRTMWTAQCEQQKWTGQFAQHSTFLPPLINFLTAR
jgi:hypothetical protein